MCGSLPSPRNSGRSHRCPPILRFSAKKSLERCTLWRLSDTQKTAMYCCLVSHKKPSWQILCVPLAAVASGALGQGGRYKTPIFGRILLHRLPSFFSGNQKDLQKFRCAPPPPVSQIETNKLLRWVVLHALLDRRKSG